jgi:hypothetical protein
MCYNLSETFRNVRHLKHKIVIINRDYNVMFQQKTLSDFKFKEQSEA